MQANYQKNICLSIIHRALSALNLTAVFVLPVLLLIFSAKVNEAQRRTGRTGRTSGGAVSKKRADPGQTALDEGGDLFDQGDTASLQAAMAKFQEARQLFQQSGNRKSEADTVTMLGRTYRKLNNPDEAFKKYAEAVTLFRNMNDKAGEGAALNNIGAFARDTGQFNEGVKYYQAALSIEQSIGNKDGEAKSLNGLGECYGRLGQYQTAVNYLNQSLAVWKTLPLTDDHVRTIYNLAYVYSLSPETKQQTIAYYNDALSSARRLGNQSLQSLVLGSLGDAYDQAGDKSKAIETFNIGLTLSRQSGTSAAASQAALFSNALSSVYLRMSDKQNALKYAEAANGASDPFAKLYANLNLGFIYTWAGDEAQASQYFNQALAVATQTGNKKGEATIYCGLGNVAIINYQFNEAINYFNQALPLAGDFTIQSYALGGLMRANALLGNQAGVSQAYERTKNLTVNDGNFEGVFEISSAYALAQARFGNPQAAIQSFKTALANARQTGNNLNEARALLGLAGVLERTNDAPATLDAYRQALPIWQKLGNSLVEANILLGMGNQYYNQGQSQTAIDNFNQALAVAKSINQPTLAAFALYNLGQTSVKTGDNAKALDYYNQAETLFEAANNRQAAYQTLMNISALYDKTGDKKMAKEYKKKADGFKQ